eukprot:6074296-Amphidinium_carterae.1
MSTAPMMSMSSGQEKEEPVPLSLWDEDSGLEKGGSMPTPPFGGGTAPLGADPSELEPTSASILRCGGRTRNQEAAEQAARASIRIEDECPPHHGDLQAEMEQWLADRL